MHDDTPGGLGSRILARAAHTGTAFTATAITTAALVALGTWRAVRAAQWLVTPYALDVLNRAYDSWVPMLRALDVLKGPDSARLYQELFFKLKVKFQYPPTSLLPLELLGLFLPLNLWILNVVNCGIYILNATLLALLAHVVFRDDRVALPSAQRPIGDYRWIMTAVAFIAGLIFFPVAEALRLGQLQNWINVAFTATILLWCTNWRFAAGVALGFACTLKPQFALFLVWALIWRQWRFLYGCLALLMPVGVISILRYGIHNHLAYLDVLSFISRHGESFLTNNSINGIANRLLMNGAAFSDLAFTEFPPYNPIVHMATIIATIVFVAIPLLHGVVGKLSNAGPLHIGVAALCFTMASPVAWHHHYGIMLPLFVVALRYCLLDASDQFRRNGLVLLGLSWFLSAAYWPSLARPPLSTYTGWPPWNLVHAHVFFGAVALLGVMIVAAHHCSTAPTPRARPVL